MQPRHDCKDGFVGFRYLESRNMNSTLPSITAVIGGSLIIGRNAGWRGIITVDDSIMEKLDRQP
jgi:hypothetical protein